ncbi:hypothetical protein NDU88_002122 [Pleurodeles waltl]|uniref:Uncharacterized protein n=1 Tax=Pleurodeles waltl TaxID=8319 RepID=A0AAV7VC82_PLEWA|nr:hypothetical protein NDU88_002122 [Pleurodeles waltl]
MPDSSDPLGKQLKPRPQGQRSDCRWTPAGPGVNTEPRGRSRRAGRGRTAEAKKWSGGACARLKIRCRQVPEACCGVTDCARGEREVAPGGGPGRRVGPTEILVLR